MTAARTSINNHQHEEAVSYCQSALSLSRLRPAQRARVRTLLAEALENLARYSEAVQILSAYEKAEKREELPPELTALVCLRLSSAYGGTPESEKAFSFGKQALTAAIQNGEPSAISSGHLMLGTLYRRIGETRIASDHLLQARNYALHSHDAELLAQACNGLGLVSVTEGDYDSALRAFNQARQALEVTDIPLLRGCLDINQAMIVALQGRWQESVRLLERAIPSLERARHPRLLANAWCNLGHSLVRLGEFSRAHEVLQQALNQSRQCEAAVVSSSTLETLGELYYLRGNLSEAEESFRQSLALLEKVRVGFNLAQTWLTQGRCHLLSGDTAKATEAFQASLEVSERMGDPRGLNAARLWLIEARLATGDHNEGRRLLLNVQPHLERMGNVPLVGHLRELGGKLALHDGNPDEAIRRFRQAISIWELTGERYRQATARVLLGEAYVCSGKPDQSRQILRQALRLFREMEAAPMIERISRKMNELPAVKTLISALPDPAAVVLTALNRLLEGGASQELLLHELVRILSDDLGFRQVIVFHQSPERTATLFGWHGCGEEEAIATIQRIMRGEASSVAGELHYLPEPDGSNLVILTGQSAMKLPQSIVPLLLKQAVLSLDRCRWRPGNLQIARPESDPLLEQPVSLPGLVYCHDSMRQIVEQIHKLQSSDITVLISGESGTGKEVIARGLHALSKRSESPFIPFNCAATPKDLLEAQLFGFQRGAFTGAVTESPGMIGAAEGGTLFLDEISELSRELQPKLLRFLQSGEIQRLGEVQPRQVSVRVIAAANRDLEKMITTGEFRQDLYYRLNVIQFHLPPLRERREEIPLLVTHFLNQYTTRAGRERIILSQEILDLLRCYGWPGNVRQLENEIQRLIALAPANGKITTEMLSPHIRSLSGQRPVRLKQTADSSQSLVERLDQARRQIVLEAWHRHKGNVSKAAEELGLSRFGLYKILSRYKIERDN